MMPPMKAVELLIESMLPEDVRKPGRTYSAKDLDEILAQIGRQHPDQFASLQSRIAEVGRNASYYSGETMGLSDFEHVYDRDSMLGAMDKEITLAKRETKDPDKFKMRKAEILTRYSDIAESETMRGGRDNRNSIALAVASGARGKKPQVKAMISTPGVYSDSNGDLVPIFVRHSFAEGLRPGEFAASTYGARLAVVASKTSTARGGDFGKQMATLGADLLVTNKDCETGNGVDMASDDPEIKYRVLAKAVAGYPAGTLVDGRVATAIRKTGGTVLVRSPLTCQNTEGVCAKCAGGHFTDGHLPHVGDMVGLTSAHSLGEPIAQGSLSCLMEGTLVRMADGGVKPIEAVRKGDYVLGADKEGNTFPAAVTRTYDQGLQDVYRFRFRRGATQEFLELFSTKCHKVLANTKKSSCKEEALNHTLRIMPVGTPGANSFGIVLPTRFMGDTSAVHEPFALLIGVMLGDGIRNDGKGPPRFSCADLKQIEDMRPVARSLGLEIKKCKRSHDWRFTSDTQFTGMRGSQTGQFEPGWRNPLKVKLHSLGLLDKYAHEKMLPPAVWTWDWVSVVNLVAGYLATDGSIYRDEKGGWVGLSFGSTSKRLLQEFKELIEVRLAVHCSGISTQPMEKSITRRHDMHTLHITREEQIRRLLQLMTFLPGVKSATAHRLLSKPVPKKYSPYYRCSRTDIIPVGQRRCYDIEVAHEDHLFVLANHMIVSNSKHTAGITGQKRTYSGFDVISSIVQSPDSFPNRATVAEQAGEVGSIVDAPQGGKIISINGEDHYVPHGVEILVKPGQQVEAGDQLADGIVDARDILRTRGLGEARLHYANRLKQAMDDSGMKTNRVATEMLARNALNHVTIDDPEGVGDYLPDDVASYNMLQGSYHLPKDARHVDAKSAGGQYLQQNALHYTIGTKLTPRMTAHLEKNGFPKLLVSGTEPGFHSEMSRLRTASNSTDDWIARLGSSYLAQGLEDSATRGLDTTVTAPPGNVHWQPRLAAGENFGKDVRTTGKF